jgi:hypothetical protein
MRVTRFALAVVLAMGSAAVARAQQIPPDTAARFQTGELSVDAVTADVDPLTKPGRPATDVVVVSEGYKDDPDERARFLRKARGMATTLRDEDHAAAVPMREVTTFDFYYVWLPSKSRAPWRCAERAGATKFGACLDKDGTLGTCDPAVDRASKAVASKFHLGKPNHVMITVILIRFMSSDRKDPDFDKGDHDSDDIYGDPKKAKEAATSSERDARDLADTPEQIYLKVGARSLCKKRGGHTLLTGGYEIGRVRQVDIDMDAFVHEFGHARFGLDDEYANDDTTAVGPDDAKGIAQFPNCTTDPTGARWKDIPEVWKNGKLFTDAKDPVGVAINAPDHKLIEGGSGLAKGVWHAFRRCRMNQSLKENFCPVCIHAIQQANKKAPPAPAWVDPTPPNGDLAIDAKATAEKPATVKVAWSLGEARDDASAVECFHLTLAKKKGGGFEKTPWTADLEGQARSMEIPFPGEGEYVLTLEAQGVAIALLAGSGKWPKIERHYSVSKAGPRGNVVETLDRHANEGRGR